MKPFEDHKNLCRHGMNGVDLYTWVLSIVPSSTNHGGIGAYTYDSQIKISWGPRSR
jgi:hypothetical protein